MQKYRGVLGFAGLALLAAPALAATPLTTVRVASGLTRPVFITHAPGDTSRIFVIEKRGAIRIIQNGVLLATPFLDIDPRVTGGTSDDNEQGLLGLAFHPDYANNGYFYVNYTGVVGAGDTYVSRFSVTSDPNVADPNSEFNILSFDQPANNHNGGWISFGPDGYLYIATGDGGGANDSGTGHHEPGGNGQWLGTRLGKMLRVDIDGGSPYAVPADNPFVGVVGALPEIWAYGLRNPWRDCFDRATGDLWIADVGQNSWEEINVQPAGSPGGQNYGWRCREGMHNFNFGDSCPSATFTEPIYEYSHSLGCAITGGCVYRGCAIPDLDGTYFYADYCSSSIWSFRYTGGAVTEFTNRTTELDPVGSQSITSIVSFGEDALGEIYIADQSGGEIFKIVPATMIDCNSNGVADSCDIATGASRDVNNDGIPDECQGCLGDIDGDLDTDLSDLGIVLAAYGTCAGDAGYDPAADFDGNDCIDLSDLGFILADFGCGQ